MWEGLFQNTYVRQIIMMYTLNILQFYCRLYFKKAEKSPVAPLQQKEK